MDVPDAECECRYERRSSSSRALGILAEVPRSEGKQDSVFSLACWPGVVTAVAIVPVAECPATKVAVGEGCPSLESGQRGAGESEGQPSTFRADGEGFLQGRCLGERTLPRCGLDGAMCGKLSVRRHLLG